jgi:membrane fusion protein
LKEPSFKVRAALKATSVEAYNAAYPLKSGLTASADIALDKRPLYLWVIEPVLRLKGTL